MYYNDFDKIETDEFVGTKFGKENQLEVIGWSGRSNKAKMYVLKCITCSKDPELYGDGLFKSIKSSLKVKQIPCGCSSSARRDERYYKIVCQRKANELGYIFHDWADEFTDRKTKLVLECPYHGIWCSGIINNFINRNVGCPGCRFDAVGKRASKPDEEFIKDFFDTGAFPTKTLFTRSDNKNINGHRIYWNMYCPECETTIETTANSLIKGCRGCACGKHRQKQAYVNLIKDDDLVIGIKFGIANDAVKRVKDHNKNSVFKIENLFIYEFESKKICKEAEKHCLSKLECGIFSKEEFRDGWTETTHPFNLEAICSIYEQYGGVKQEGFKCH